MTTRGGKMTSKATHSKEINETGINKNAPRFEQDVQEKPHDVVKGVTTRGGKMTSKATRSKEINETGININEPPGFEQDVQEKPNDDGVENKSSSIPERTTQPLVKPQQSSIPFPNRVRKEKEEALQQNFLENLKQLDINIPFIKALV
ncbi:hypothetical protein Tco_1428176 [Tanacetum coccineum]